MVFSSLFLYDHNPGVRNFLFYFQTAPPPPPRRSPSPSRPWLGMCGLQLKGLLVVQEWCWWGGGGSGGGEEVNSQRGSRPTSCFICRAQRWPSLLTASRGSGVDGTAAAGCAFQWPPSKYTSFSLAPLVCLFLCCATFSPCLAF